MRSKKPLQVGSKTAGCCSYERQAYRRSTVISATAGARVDEEGLTFDVRIQPHGEWTTEIDVAATLPRVQQRGGRPPRQGNGGGRTWNLTSGVGSVTLPGSSEAGSH